MSKIEPGICMKKTIMGYFMAFFCLFPLVSQPESVSEADFTGTRISIAGPDKVFMRGIEFEGESYSALVQALDPEGNSWQITRLYLEKENLAPPAMILDLADVLPEENNILTLSGIIVNGNSYSASFKIDESGALRIVRPIEEAPMPEGFLDKLGSFKDLLTEAAEEKYETRITDLVEKTEAQELRIENLTRENSEKSRQVEELTAENREHKQAVEELSGQIAAAEAGTEEAGEGSDGGTEAASAEEDGPAEESVAIDDAPADTGTGDGAPAADDGRRINDFTFTKSLLEGFARSVPQLGFWEVTENEAIQIDENQYFAKLVLPIEQQTRPTLFTFKTRSRGYGWVGTGLHIFATDKQRLKGYGFGNSLLIWLTRDPEYYGTMDTRLQLYRSDDAVQMEMVLDAVIEEHISEYLDMAILYEPEEEYITISVNGIEKLRYKTWFSIDEGVEVALRTLGGGGEFKDLVIKVAD